MHRISARLSRTSTSFSTLITNASKRTFTSHSAASLNLQKLQQPTIPNHFLKWGSFGFIRTSRFATGFSPLEPKPLDSIMDIQQAKDKSLEDLASIWDNLIKYFVIPLWRGNGYTTMFVQVQMPHMIFTSLEDYKARGTQAAPYFNASFYTEFAESKDLVLIWGDVVFTSKLSDEEAKWPVETTQSFYLNDVRYKLVEKFNKESYDFEFKDVLRVLNMPIL